MKKHLTNPWRVAFFVVLAIILVWYAVAPRGDRYTVRMYRSVYSDEYGMMLHPSITPEREAEWSSGSHDAPVHRTRFDGAVSRNSGGYGPQTLRGSFAREDVQKLCPGLPLSGDWPFSISVFKTNGDDAFRFDLSVMLPEEPDGEARATLYIFREGYPRPEIMEWTGCIGEGIVFAAEV